MTATFARHRLDATALVAGLVFLTLGGLVLAGELDWIELSGRRAFGVTILALGVAGAVAALAAALRNRRPRPVEETGSGGEAA